MKKLGMLTGPIGTAELVALKPQLCRMQGHILRSHGREHSIHLLLRFNRGMQEQVSGLIRDLASAKHGIITSAWKQQVQSQHKQQHPDTMFGSFYLSAAGYEYFDPRLLTGFSPEFRGGLKGAQARLDDSHEEWVDGYQDGFHAMILLANANRQKLHERVQEMRRQFASVTACCLKEEGKVTKENGKAVEHFKFVENISQPLFFEKDVKAQQERGGIDRENPQAAPSLVLVEDPNAAQYSPDTPAYGSYLVFRKLQQHVQRFQCYLDGLADALRLQGQDRLRAEALIMGRFRDGTPIVVQPTPGGYDPALNNFDFSKDPQGVRCPFQAHIRKMNPRGDRDRGIQSALAAARLGLSRALNDQQREEIQRTLADTLKRHLTGAKVEDDCIPRSLDQLLKELLKAGPFDYTHLQQSIDAVLTEQPTANQPDYPDVQAAFAAGSYERRHRIARRSVSYGTQGQDSEVGLLFMCYQNDIKQQFEFLQANWANREDFLANATGVDTIIGPQSTASASKHDWQRQWNGKKEAPHPFSFQSCVTLKGGEYFFAPSLPFLRNLTACAQTSSATGI